MLPKSKSYADLKAGFSWDIPGRLNMAHQVCDLWAETAPSRTALIDVTGDERRDVSYSELRTIADGLAHYLAERVQPGDRVGVLRSQSVWTAAAHIAIWKIGAISIPLFKLFAHDALQVRLGDAGARLVICDAETVHQVEELGYPTCVPEDLQFSDQPFATRDTSSEDPAVLIYTSGTTGSPKGALHAHRVLAGHLPGVEISHNLLGQDADVLWTPADWAWIGGLFDVLMPGLALGVPVVASRSDKFSAEFCRQVVSRAAVLNVFFPPTALRMLKADNVSIQGLRTIASGGEPLGPEMLEWGQNAFGLTINEFYGQTECNMVASSASALFDPQLGCIGKPVPGHDIAVLDDLGNPTQIEGDIAVKKGSASMMLEYWNKPSETAAKYKGPWMLTGDRGIWQGEYLRFIGREDDVITSAGYRIGPAEIEDCLLKHPSVATVGVVGKPDELRTEIVKAYVVLKPEVVGSDNLVRELQNLAKSRVSKHSYPREITFLKSLPMTVTGKIIRKDLKRRATAEKEPKS
ncbi:MAG: AMP-binding protein [Paracoccaceae bacterium]|nr:AMP-binding protein [Paracoccaceae bacterium]